MGYGIVDVGYLVVTERFYKNLFADIDKRTCYVCRTSVRRLPDVESLWSYHPAWPFR